MRVFRERQRHRRACFGTARDGFGEFHVFHARREVGEADFFVPANRTNEFGLDPLTIEAAQIAISAGTSAITAGSADT